MSCGASWNRGRRPRRGVLTSPIIPGLNDHELPSLVAAEAGAQLVSYGVVHLPYGVRDPFAGWLEQTLPERSSKILNRIRAMRGGGLNDPRFGHRMRGEGAFAEQLAALHRLACKRAGGYRNRASNSLPSTSASPEP